MKRYTHIIGFTQESNIDYFELDSGQSSTGPIAVKKDGSRVDFRAHWDERWTKEAIETGRWIEMLDGESSDTARERIRLLDDAQEEAELDSMAECLAEEIENRDSDLRMTDANRTAMSFSQLMDWTRDQKGQD